MRTRKQVSLWAFALVIGFILGAAPGALHAADVRGQGKGKGKVGDLCKSNNDCQQSPRALYCRDDGSTSKCAAPPSHPVT